MGRGSELYECFYRSDAWRMTHLVYRSANATFAESLVEQFMHDWSATAGGSSVMKSSAPCRVCLPKRVG